jgi:hypothetical protein
VDAGDGNAPNIADIPRDQQYQADYGFEMPQSQPKKDDKKKNNQGSTYEVFKGQGVRIG